MNNKIRIFLTTIRDARAEQLIITERNVKISQDLLTSGAGSQDAVDQATIVCLEAKVALAIAEMELVKAF